MVVKSITSAQLVTFDSEIFLLDDFIKPILSYGQELAVSLKVPDLGVNTDLVDDIG
jgi:hypothetical protein